MTNWICGKAVKLIWGVSNWERVSADGVRL